MNIFPKFPQGLSDTDFLARYANDAQKLRWKQVHDAVVLTPAQRELLRSFKRKMNVACLAGAWCGDCSGQCPIFAHFAAVAPVAWKGLLFLSMVDPARSGHGTIYALDAATGVVRWRFAPVETTGPVSIDTSGRLYATTLKLVLDARSGRLLQRGQGTHGTTPILAKNGRASCRERVYGPV